MTEADREMLALLHSERLPFIIVMNKIDRVSQKEAAAARATIEKAEGDAHVVPFSSMSKRGLAALEQELFA